MSINTISIVQIKYDELNPLLSLNAHNNGHLERNNRLGFMHANSILFIFNWQFVPLNQSIPFYAYFMYAISRSLTGKHIFLSFLQFYWQTHLESLGAQPNLLDNFKCTRNHFNIRFAHSFRMDMSVRLRRRIIQISLKFSQSWFIGTLFGSYMANNTRSAPNAQCSVQW